MLNWQFLKESRKLKKLKEHKEFKMFNGFNQATQHLELQCLQWISPKGQQKLDMHKYQNLQSKLQLTKI